MKIDEPKTPYAKRYDPSEDEDEMRTLDADDLVVDELDRYGRGKSRTKEDEIPGLELGEPEEVISDTHEGDGRIMRSGSLKGEKQVVVDPSANDGGHGEYVGSSAEEREKHRHFEEMRKKHYEMKDIKGLLGYWSLKIFHVAADGPTDILNSLWMRPWTTRRVHQLCQNPRPGLQMDLD